MDVIWPVTAAVGVIAINLIASELFAWGPRLSECLVRRATRRLAPEIRERMQEEWAAHLQTMPDGLWRIVTAAGFYLATRQINVALRIRESQEKLDEKTRRRTGNWGIEEVVISGPPGTGKSALVARYHEEGHRVIFLSHGDLRPPSQPPSTRHVVVPARSSTPPRR